ncbi:hypothetical protein OVS_04340 [Mycoplasma ovis str. Michigan]|uniref:Uncharacterized protein n=1 Tax=Mycoplasma ovis str. Michigan TaxID=1415773 RepID=A0ABM5P2B1_9MOLU|nr:hypothetical protein OVS_04340 [Mycoplasma ovis str. Michigan]
MNESILSKMEFMNKTLSWCPLIPQFWGLGVFNSWAFGATPSCLCSINDKE